MDELLDTLPCGVVSFDDEGTVRATNATLRALLGYAPGEIEGRHVERLFTVAGRIFYQTHLFPLLRLHGRADEIFLPLRTKDGREVGALVNGARRERAGVVVNDCVLLEVRERRKYEDELLRARRAAEDANRAKSEFLARMSHDLRTPLNAIGGYTQLIEIGVHGPVTDAQADALGRIRRAQLHLLTLINDILSFAKLEAGQVQIELRALPVSDAIDALRPLVEPDAAGKGLRLELGAARDDVCVRADRDRLLQILLNLVGNAVKFTPAGGTISVRHAATADAVAIRVSDTGRGIPPDRLDAIFDPFVQTGAHSAIEREGVGLGLAISRELARLMGGSLTAESTLGAGSTFTLTLPRAAPTA